MKQTILIVEDEVEIAHFTQKLLEKEGFNCQTCYDGVTAIRYCQQLKPILVILDWALPEMDGIEVCTRIRKLNQSPDPYILMLTAKGEEIDRVVGLSTGADDYVVKPFSPMVLIARIRALLRRSLREEERPQIYQTEHFTVDLTQHQAQRHLESHTEILDLTAIEAARLRWSDVDLKEGTIYIRRIKGSRSGRHPLQGDEMRALKKLKRDYAPSPFVFNEW
ncbi:MAG: response regulator [Cyanobacteria bacterium P01_G01_bin.67]